ncbi:LysR family transcriptional regulator [Oceaniglobus indicus]|uniref:LysR family transcriptional regulator n=1 Tax=Oceaniglobus indicus TaxID=2047749 RepID=UPI000C1A1638|nr:LysR family transcriptional regulator [Oceaniglobus indicus]
MGRLNLDQIAAFLAVVRLGGIGKAAQGLGLTQPAVSARIRNLETGLSQTLFDRTPGGLRLTRDGETMLRYAERYEQLNELVERHVVNPDALDGLLRIGSAETVAQCWLPDFVSHLHRRFPSVEVEINVDVSVNLRAALLTREIDLAFLLGPVSDFSVDNIALPAFELGWYAATDADIRDDDPSLFLDTPVLSYARNTAPYRHLKSMLLERVGPGVTLFPSSSLSACFRLIESGIGVAALPCALAASYVAAGRIRTFDPGWRPAPLAFTASFIGGGQRHLVATAADLALDVARRFDGHKSVL